MWGRVVIPHVGEKGSGLMGKRRQHVVLDASTGEYLCERCGTRVPMLFDSAKHIAHEYGWPLDYLIESMNAFIANHKRCSPKTRAYAMAWDAGKPWHERGEEAALAGKETGE